MAEVGWLDRLEAARIKAFLLGSVVPRAVLTSRAASRRSEDSGIPAWRLGIREFAETATDELFVAISALYREAPDLDHVTAAVEECRTAAEELSQIDTRGTPAPTPGLQLLGLRRRRVAGILYEHLEYESRPQLPTSLMTHGHGDVEVAHARVLRHRDGPRPWVVWIHGAEQGRVDDLFAFRVRHLHEELGFNLALPVLPQHGPRRHFGRAWPGFDLLGNIATMLRAVSDVRVLLGWIDEQSPTSTAVVGMSLGAPVAALTAGQDPRVDAVVAMVPMLDAHATIAYHVGRTGRRGREFAALLRDPAVVACGAAVDPTAAEPYAAPDRRLVVAALGDRMTSVQAAQRLHERWGGQIHWHHGGHIGHLLSADVRSTIDGFLLAGAPPQPINRG